MFRRREVTVLPTGRPEGPTGIYIIDPVRSTIGFSVRHAAIACVHGRFTAFEGILKLDGSRPTRSEIHLSVQTGSLDTGSPEQDTHGTGPDCLDSATFPLMTFRSTGIRDAGDERYRVAGRLRIKGLELPVHIDVERGRASRDVHGEDRVGFVGTTVVHGSDRGLGAGPAPATGGSPTGDEVRLTLGICAVQVRRAESA
ncbi:YceI family protein [Streptomyces sp. NPDC048231]|uniref:YceI family protein n=1 Tax=Streptomyces sp. NPDC048231 TaxID=3365519 RepID=UPI0037117437